MKATFALSALLATVAVALPTPTSIVPGAATSSAVSTVSKTVHSVLTVTNQQTGKNMLVELEQGFANQLTGLNLGSASSPVGKIVQTAGSLSELQSLTSGLTGLTFVTSTGEYVLVELDNTVEGLLASLGLSAVGEVVGTVVSTLEGVVSNLKRSELNNVLSITGLNNEPILVNAESTLTNALDLSAVKGTVGTVVASVPGVSDLASKASELGLPTNELFGVLSADGSSALLVRVESLAGGLTSTVTGLLSTLGLGDLTTTVGTVVTSAQGVTAL
ncbi:uncharacterized protein N7484_007343 [Penicillium longicatenatum]|uniref:uncharacterized protein n=1 Tax=Penicillium longicatenatum TaxID=1561947 RepID=UPI0025489A18|nr:uncharacterized protein N7484_007343 [Penicillium longicatenatum]KAJ5639481.1 hypothetical protein N7484_007343 [Penicillium longicatenatum]KAJ5652155.1 hypothetical protein N7507_009581 [Penicillium longicatenatum]